MERRRATGWTSEDNEATARRVHLWQHEVHRPGIYDLELDTSILSPEACAAAIRRHLEDGPPPSAFQRLAAMSTHSD